MAKGAIAKDIITKKILETFEGAFLYNDKEIRIPILENGETVQIKISLVCAKVNVENGAGAPAATNTSIETNLTPISISNEEKEEVNSLIQKLGL